MLAIPYVCAEFRDRAGNQLFRITPPMLRNFTEIPETVKQDPLFAMLVQDGSIQIPETAAQKKLLEKEPMLGMMADGRNAVKSEKPAKESKPKAESKAESKAETKADEKPAGTKPAEPENQ